MGAWFWKNCEASKDYFPYSLLFPLPAHLHSSPHKPTLHVALQAYGHLDFSRTGSSIAKVC